MSIAKSELILNDDQSVYHLNLLPGDVAETIITVGDQERVAEVSKFFDSIELKKNKREFTCHTGYIGKKRLSVVSTGIGTDNIDIVFNEIDALFNIDFKTREAKEDLTILDFIRLGTSGSISRNVLPGQFLISELAVGIDNMNNFYSLPIHLQDPNFNAKLADTLSASFNAYSVKANKDLLSKFQSNPEFVKGKTLTSIGFYGPQGRLVRNQLISRNFLDSLQTLGLSNIEMETSGIYLLAANLGHRAVSLNAILANRLDGSFAEQADKIVDTMIVKSLEIICS